MKTSKNQLTSYSLQTWIVSRIQLCELPKLHEHKFVSHPKLKNIFFGNKLTMLFAEFLNSRSISLQLGGHDAIQVAKKMTKDSRDKSHCEQSSQQSSQNPTKYHTDLTRRRIGLRPEHQMFFLLVFFKIKTCCK